MPDCDWPDVLTDPSVEMGPVFPPRLKRGQGSRHLGVDIPFNPDEEDTVCDNSQRNKYFSSSGNRRFSESAFGLYNESYNRQNCLLKFCVLEVIFVLIDR